MSVSMVVGAFVEGPESRRSVVVGPRLENWSEEVEKYSVVELCDAAVVDSPKNCPPYSSHSLLDGRHPTITSPLS